MSRRSVRWLALALPLVVANFVLSDPFYLVAPWIIVPLATVSWSDRRWHSACLLALAFVLGPMRGKSGHRTNKQARQNIGRSWAHGIEWSVYRTEESRTASGRCQTAYAPSPWNQPPGCK